METPLCRTRVKDCTTVQDVVFSSTASPRRQGATSSSYPSSPAAVSLTVCVLSQSPFSHKVMRRSDVQVKSKPEATEPPAQYRLSSGGIATITSLPPKSQKAVMWKAMLEKTTRYSKKANRV
ncbi:hypothetical protein INR49_004609 [Caranx melampygus]|nr:hypothetical protein INR49_004609 [Caranx melampygus]